MLYYYIYRAVGGNAEAPFVHIMGEEVRFDIIISIYYDSADDCDTHVSFYFLKI